MKQEHAQPPVDGLRAGELRVHVGLTTPDLARSVEFYRALLGTDPSKRRADYAKFEPLAPRLNLSLVERPDADANPDADERPARSQHLGLQVATPAARAAIATRLQAAGFAARVEDATTCCYALQDKTWFEDPAGNAWEVYVLRADADALSPPSSTCCVDAAGARAETRASCC